MGWELEKRLLSYATTNWIPRLNRREIISIRKYTGIEEYESINRVLREGRYDEASSYTQKLITDIENGLKKFKYSESLTVYRIVSEREYNFIKNRSKIEAFADFKSTSIAHEVTEELVQSSLKHIIIAKLPAMVDGAYIAPLSVFAGEKEFLLNRGCKYWISGHFHDTDKNIKYILIKVMK
ncbi:ADP-ribosyltransferase [Salinicoccus kekensis]|uniref:ADP-ribosyltransferase exoenzyme n=1 Tax=Salinicoccus kekensis TaxID=714307 RepID=A0A285UP70_9STAP|nr:ADP-ribosyltransferase [Salinicoccus kekensis]SOC43684.1 ADP-ribosyltransferase exoenzyme [Salinicoccus kekensis]